MCDLVLLSGLHSWNCFDAGLCSWIFEFLMMTLIRGIQVDSPVLILSNKRKLMIDIILVFMQLGFIVRASLLKLFWCQSMQLDSWVFVDNDINKRNTSRCAGSILSNKRKWMIGIILVRVPVGFIVRALLLKVFWCQSMLLDFLIFNVLSCY